MTTALNKFDPPLDYVLQSGPSAAQFSREAIETKELWLLRIPDNVSAEDLDGLTIKNPSTAPKGIVLDEAKISGTSYQIVTQKATNVCAEFKGMTELNLLVPDTDEDNDDEEAGLLTLLPGRCVQMMALVEKIDIPDSVQHAKSIATKVKAAREQPENMQLRFIPYGFYSADEYRSKFGTAQNQIQVDSEEEEEELMLPPKKKQKHKRDALDVEMNETKLEMTAAAPKKSKTKTKSKDATKEKTEKTKDKIKDKKAKKAKEVKE
ncbi:hypothetical protein LPJ66_007227 [Kickxella alabastrina]|uniref:Uncharacterized protein n=1 Tax=Kickxella alabastrina TaxID=61397 RepID=A0ACC1IDF9_9FUNG|nr:hypothetical protein LPJ66_007227 [Kickxella alabastrina]